MWPYMIRLNPAGLMMIILVSFGLYMLYYISIPSELKRIPTNYDPMVELKPSSTSSNEDDPFRVNLRSLLIASIQAAESGGKEVHRIWESAKLETKSKGLTKEGKKELVTKGDLGSHKVMVHGLSATFPGLQVISEESETEDEEEDEAIERLDFVKPFHLNNNPVILTEELRSLPFTVTVPMKSVTVWIDPLDATQEYTESQGDVNNNNDVSGEELLKYVTTMVCVAVNGKPIIGIIHKPFDHVTYWGWIGQNVSSLLRHLKSDRNNVVSRRQGNGNDGQESVIVSRSHPGEVSSYLKSKLGNNINIIHAGGAGYKIIEVIKGSADAYIHNTLIKKWDICAPNAIIDSMDGKMSTLKGHLISYSAEDDVKNEDGLLATATFLDHHKFLDKLTVN